MATSSIGAAARDSITNRVVGKSTAAAPDLAQLSDELHGRLAFRAGAIAEAAFQLAQHQRVHSEISARASFDAEFRDKLPSGWADPGCDDNDALSELLRELCSQMRGLAAQAAALNHALGGNV